MFFFDRVQAFQSPSNRLATTVEESIASLSSFPSDVSLVLTGLQPGHSYRLQVTPISPSGVEGLALPDVVTEKLPEEDKAPVMTVVSVEAATKQPSNSSSNLMSNNNNKNGGNKDPIRLLPVIGIKETYLNIRVVEM